MKARTLPVRRLRRFRDARSSLLDHRVRQCLPLVEQRRVGLPDHGPQPLDQVLELVGAHAVGHRLPQGTVGVAEVAQHQPLGPGEPVERDVLGERHRPLVHVAHHRLRGQRVLGDPRVAAPVDLVGVLEQLLQRLGPADLVEQLHPLVVLDAVGLHLADRLAARLVLLGAEHRPRVLEGGLDDRHHVEGVRRRARGRARRRPPRANVDSGWLSAKPSCRSSTRRTVRPSAAGGSTRSTTPAASSARCCATARRTSRTCARPSSWLSRSSRRIAVERVALAGDDVEQHRVADPHPGDQRLRARPRPAGRRSPRSR